MADSLPRYADLPLVAGKPPGSSWGLWGDDDRLGCLNLLTPERAVRGRDCVKKGAVFALNLDLHLPEPPLFRRAAFEHRINSTAASNDDELSHWNTQSSSQWDGFRHIRHREHGHYNGLPDEEHGIHVWAQKGLVGRAVLCDVARYLEAEGRPLDYTASQCIETADIEGALAAQGVSVEVGDVLLLRTGWMSWYRGLDASARAELAASEAMKNPGIRPGKRTAAFLWDLHIAAIGADNPALEVWPPGSAMQGTTPDPDDEDPAPEFFLHFALLPLLGLPIGELWDLDALAADCANDGVYEAMFTSAPINLLHGVASPPNALAIK